MAHLTDIDNVAPANSLKVGADILNTWRTRIDVLNDALGDITSVEADQIEAIGTTTISAAQWGYLGACVAGGGQLLAALTASESTQLEAIGATTISAAQWGYLGACTAAGGAILDDADASAQRTTLGLAIGTDVLAYDAGLSNLAGISMAADKFYYTSADNTHVAGTITTFGRSIIDDADEATFKGTVNLEIGTDVQAYDADLSAIAALAKTDGNFIVGNGSTWIAESGATARTSLGLGSMAIQAHTSVNIDGGTVGGVTLDGAIAGGDQTFTNVGNMTFTAGSILKSGGTNADTLLLAANDTTFITLTTGSPDTCAISGAAIDNCIIGAGTAAALTCTTFTSTGIDDNADATALTISVDEVVSLGAAKLTVGSSTPTTAQWAQLAGYDTTAKARAYLGANQPDLTTNIACRIDLDTENYDPGSNFDNGLLGSGTADGTSAGHLIDSGYDFAAVSIAVGMRIKNTTDTTYTYITAVAVGDLTLRDNIFVDTETWEVQAARFVAPVTGYYLLTAGLLFNGIIADKKYISRIYVNAASVCEAHAHSTNLTTNIGIFISDVQYLTASDYVELFGRQEGGASTVDVLNGSSLTFLACHLLSV